MASSTLFLLAQRLTAPAHRLGEWLRPGDQLLLLEDGVYNLALLLPEGVNGFALEADCTARGVESPWPTVTDAAFVELAASAERVVTLTPSLLA
jgi:sulfur relay protein TusB/DsrH